MEFFATTGEYKNETEWRNPAGGWLRQIIPKGDQLPKFLDDYEKIYNDLNKHLPAESIIEDDYLDGRITLSHKGVHFAETQYRISDGHGFWEDELDTDLTQALPIHRGSAHLDSMQLGNAQGYHLGGDRRMCRADGFSVQFEHLASHGG